MLRPSVAPPLLPDLSTASEAAMAAILREAKLAEADPRIALLRGNFACVLLAHQFDSAAAGGIPDCQRTGSPMLPLEVPAGFG
ncbi:MAG UNVERIFIED_CONTAM: hypothetical protein LVR18_12710 [Planctomycetaceae bacterium]